MSKRKFLDVEKQKQRFSIRKLTIGAASVLLVVLLQCYLGQCFI
ncbi:YSIRK-type signal peptide-containing protein [Lactobacillus helveticus]|nr:YSIRK-type signal peptide-containing protein [Lactobacillus helveticus]